MTNRRMRRDYHRLPGLYRSWELPQILTPGRDYRLEKGGETEDGAPLVLVWVRAPGAGGTR